MSEQSHAGHFVWHDLMSPDPERAEAFYTEIVGWTTSKMEMGHGGDLTLFSVGEDQVGDVVPLDASQGLPPHWRCYVSVDDTDAALAKAESLGGKVVMPAFDSPYGRIAGLQDPGGANILVVSATEAPPAPSWPPPQGTFCWYELMVPDPAAVTPFYEQVFGWKRGEGTDMGNGVTYFIFQRGEAQTAGMMALPPGVPVANWLPYIAVDDVDAATAKATTLGATVLMGPDNVPGTGRFSVLQDPTGAAVALFTGSPAAS